MSEADRELTFEDIKKASIRCAPHVHRTPLLIKSNMTAISGWDVLMLKAEIFQRCSTFKYRGAVNAVLCEVDRKKKSGDNVSPVFVTHSSGNNAAAVARASKIANCACHVVLPRNTPKTKVDAIKQMGTNITECDDDTYQERVRACEKLVESIPHATYIHPTENVDLLAGHGAIGIELLEQFSTAIRRFPGNDATPDVIILPVGGGGLIAGAAIALRKLAPNSLIVAAEPAFAADLLYSIREGKITKQVAGRGKKVADGLLTHVNERLMKIVKENVDEIVTVTEQEIARSMILILQRLKVVIEPASALAAAVALFHRAKLSIRFPDRNLKTCLCLLSEGNVDVSRISEISKI